MLNPLRKAQPIIENAPKIFPVVVVAFLAISIGLTAYFSQRPTDLEPEAVSDVENACPNLSQGQGGFVQATLNACGDWQLVSGDICSSVVQLKYRAPRKNAAGEWETLKFDGQIKDQDTIIEKTLGDSRNNDPNFIGTDYINCNMYLDYSDRTSCDVDPPPKGREGVGGGKLVPGEEVTITVRPEPTQTGSSPGCRIQLQTEVPGSTTPSPTPSSSSSANPSPSPTSQTSPNPTKGGDINGDGVINSIDFTIVATSYKTQSSTQGDLDNDGVVSLRDISILLSNWTASIVEN